MTSRRYSLLFFWTLIGLIIFMNKNIYSQNPMREEPPQQQEIQAKYINKVSFSAPEIKSNTDSLSLIFEPDNTSDYKLYKESNKKYPLAHIYKDSFDDFVLFFASEPFPQEKITYENLIIFFSKTKNYTTAIIDNFFMGKTFSFLFEEREKSMSTELEREINGTWNLDQITLFYENYSAYDFTIEELEKKLEKKMDTIEGLRNYYLIYDKKTTFALEYKEDLLEEGLSFSHIADDIEYRYIR